MLDREDTYIFQKLLEIKISMLEIKYTLLGINNGLAEKEIAPHSSTFAWKIP